MMAGLMLCGCGQLTGTGASSGDPREEHILMETQRFAALLNVRVHAVVTDEVYMVRSSDGSSMVPAAGWYYGGNIKYWRPVVIERSFEYGSALAAHETCHALYYEEKWADQCAQGLLND